MLAIYRCQRIINEERFVKTQQAIIASGKEGKQGYAYQQAIERMEEYERERAKPEPNTK